MRQEEKDELERKETFSGNEEKTPEGVSVPEDFPMEVVVPETPVQQEQADKTATPKKPRKESARKLASLLDDDDDEATLKQWKDAWKQVSIDGQWFKRQLGVLCVLVLGIIIYITNRYQAEQEIIEEENLRQELQDWKFRSLTRNSELTFYTRQSQIEEKLRNFGDTTLLPAVEAPIKIEMSNKNE